MSVNRIGSCRQLFRLFLVTVIVGLPAISRADDGDSGAAKPAKSNSLLGNLAKAFFGANSEEEATPATSIGETTPVVSDGKSTHKQAAKIKVSGKGGQQLRTFCVNNAGTIYGIVGPERPYGDVSLTDKNNKAEIRVLDEDGKEQGNWPVPFAAQAIAVAPNGTVVVAGNGRIAKYDNSGKLLLETDVPHVIRVLNKPEALQEEAEANLEESKEQYEVQLKQVNETLVPMKEELEKLEAVAESGQTPKDTRRIKALKNSIRSQEAVNKANLQYYKQRGERKLDVVVKELTGRLKTINALAVTDEDVFIASGVTRGYGYAVWRTNFDFDGGKQIVSGLSGCCGQMDIRCCDDGVYVAENSRKRVLHFDREGKKLAQWGEGDRNGSAGAKFGGCCNPMNLCLSTGGELLTAESEGFVKRFTKDGQFLGIVGHAKVSGGCKNVAIGISPNGEKVYFYDRQESTIVVLNKQGESAPAKPSESGS